MLITLALTASSAFAQNQPVTGETVTYHIELQEGDNLVSLPVLPDTSAMELVVADILPELVLVHDNMGHYYVPEIPGFDGGVSHLEEWVWEHVYNVVVNTPTTLTVEGAEILPEATSVPLEAEVWNRVPLYQNRPLSVEEAFSTIADHIDRVQDAWGRFYEPGNGDSTLDSLRIGHGYEVWVNQATTLVYPPNTPPDGGDVTEVGTLGQALALTELEVGQEIEVLGYYTPGDGGGGTFRVENSGATPDGGTVFALQEHTSAPVVEVLPNHQTARYLNLLPAGERVVYGSLTIDLLDPESEEAVFSFEGRDLHGHEWLSHYNNNLTFDYETGAFHDRRQRLKSTCGRLTGEGGWTCALRFTYRSTTSDLRLVRQGVGSTLNADWFGARTYAEASDFDNQPVINHMINVADRMNAETPGTITTIYLPEPAVYEYFGSIRLSDGLTLKGAAGTELVTVTNDLGHTYSPVRVKDEHTTLRVKSDEALTHIRMEKDPSDPDYLESDAKQFLHNRPTAIYIQPDAMSAGLEDIVLDGNWEGNQQAWTEGWATTEEKETWMRNTPGWSGVVSTDHNGIEIPIGQHLTLRNVQISGYGGTEVLGDANNTWTGENVRLGNALWNHAMYSTNGTWTNLTFEGFAWTQAIFTAMSVTNLVYEAGAPAPYRQGPDLVNFRGGDAYSEDDPDGSFEQVTRSDGTVIELGNTIDGFYIDLRGSAMSNPFNGLGPDIEVRNGRVIASEGAGIQLFRENGNGYQDALYPNYRFENITVYDHGAAGGSNHLFQNVKTTHSLFRNITKTDALLPTEGQGGFVLDFRADWRNHPAWDTVQVNVYDGIVNESPMNFIATTSIDINAVGADYFVLNSSFNNRTPALYSVNGGGVGRLDAFDANLDTQLLRVYWRDSNFNMIVNYDNWSAFLYFTRFENVTDNLTGKGSEDAGTVSLTATGGETFVDVQHEMFWTPLRSDYVSMSGSDAALVDSVAAVCGGTAEPLSYTEEQDNCDLRFVLTRALAAGEEITFNWEAAVHPWEEDVTLPEYAQ